MASLCILDFTANMCWIDKGHGVGIEFEKMGDCDSGGDCWFALTETDLIRIHNGLNKGK